MVVYNIVPEVIEPGCEALQQEGSDIRMRMLFNQPCFQCVDESSTESEAVVMGTG